MASSFDIGTDDFMKGNLQFKSEKGMEESLTPEN